MSPAWVDAVGQGDVLPAHITSVPGKRSAAQLMAVVTQFDVSRSVRYLKGARGGKVWCNRFACDVLSAMGVPIPYQRANEIFDWYQKFGVGCGWQDVPAMRAAYDASQGRPVIACWKNPVPDASGHVAIVVPSKGPGIWVAQAGLENFSFGLMRRGFGESKPVVFWSHA